MVQSVVSAVGAIFTEGHCKDLRGMQVVGYRTATDFVQSLRDNGWIQGDSMSVANVFQFLEFFVGMTHLNPRFRKSCLSLTYLPTDDLHQFLAKVRRKLGETDGLTVLSVVAVVPNTGDEALQPSFAAMAVR